jgi:hypothetical protein
MTSWAEGFSNHVFYLFLKSNHGGGVQIIPLIVCFMSDVLFILGLAQKACPII